MKVLKSHSIINDYIIIEIIFLGIVDGTSRWVVKDQILAMNYWLTFEGSPRRKSYEWCVTRDAVNGKEMGTVVRDTSSRMDSIRFMLSAFFRSNSYLLQIYQDDAREDQSIKDTFFTFLLFISTWRFIYIEPIIAHIYSRSTSIRLSLYCTLHLLTPEYLIP